MGTQDKRENPGLKPLKTRYEIRSMRGMLVLTGRYIQERTLTPGKTRSGMVVSTGGYRTNMRKLGSARTKNAPRQENTKPNGH